jgi:hypothetical protein
VDVTRLGIVKVVPVIDKVIEHLPDVVSREQMLRTEPSAESMNDFGQNLNLAYKKGFSFTGALLSAKKRAMQGSVGSLERKSSEYFASSVDPEIRIQD